MLIYKICDRALWAEATESGTFEGAPVDLADGFIHFSSAEQVRETAAKHFKGQDDLLLIAVEADDMGELLRWEPSRGGEDFPHLYRPLKVSEVAWVKPMPLRADGTHGIEF